MLLKKICLNKFKVNTEYKYDILKLLNSKLKILYMNETYYNIGINRTSTERLKFEQDDQRSKGFKYQVLDSEWIKLRDKF